MAVKMVAWLDFELAVMWDLLENWSAMLLGDLKVDMLVNWMELLQVVLLVWKSAGKWEFQLGY
jgi:hypothetical protein